MFDESGGPGGGRDQGGETGTGLVLDAADTDLLVQVDVDRLRSDYQQLAGMFDTLALEIAGQCMADLGFERLPRFQVVSIPNRIGSEARVFELDGATVETVGYEATNAARRRAFAEQESDRERAQQGEVASAWQLAWRGETPSLEEAVSAGLAEGRSVGTTGGCFGDARTSTNSIVLHDDLISRLRDVEALWGAVFDLANSSPNFVGSRNDWSRCMATSGYYYADLPDAFFAADAMVLAGTPEAALTQAIADFECQQATSIIDAYESAWSEAEKEIGDSSDALGLLSWHNENFDQITAEVMNRLDSEGLIPAE